MPSKPSWASAPSVPCTIGKATPSYTYQDIVRDMLRQGESPTGHPRRVVQEQPSWRSPLTTQLGALMRSEAYEDWLHAWELLRDHTPDHITTFDALETLFHLDVQDCSVTDMLYELDMALHNEGLEDPRLMAHAQRWRGGSTRISQRKAP